MDGENLIAELLDTIEFAEGVLIDAFDSEDGADVEAARAVAQMCSDVLVSYGRTSALVEIAKIRET